MIETGHRKLPVCRQCELLGLSRSSYYYEPRGETAFNERLMRLLDEQYLKTPFYGARRMTAVLRRMGYEVNVKRVRRLLRLMGLETIYPKKRRRLSEPGHRVYPYLLSGVTVDEVDQVWSTDITYIPLERGFLYLVLILDWHSRFVLSWRLSNTLDEAFCVASLQEALSRGKPEIFNSDQGSQFTGEAFTGCLKDAGVRISMDGRGRAFDNIFVERFWRSLKYEEVYLHAYRDGRETREGIGRYIAFYCFERPHQALENRTPHEVYSAAR